MDASVEPYEEPIPENPQVPLIRQASYDGFSPTDKEGIEYFKTHVDTDLKFDTYFNYLKRPQQGRLLNAIDIYQLDSTFINEDLRLGKTDGSIIRALDLAIQRAPPTSKHFMTYRCYKYNMTPKKINALSSNLNYLSVSVSRRIVEDWCLGGQYQFQDGVFREKNIVKEGIDTPTRVGLVISIIIPTNSKGVLPIVYGKLKNSKLNEVILHRTGKLINTNKIDRNGYPIFIFKSLESTNPNLLDLSQYKELLGSEPLEDQTPSNSGGSRKYKRKSILTRKK
jgi:hypothetical protein